MEIIDLIDLEQYKKNIINFIEYEPSLFEIIKKADAKLVSEETLLNLVEMLKKEEKRIESVNNNKTVWEEYNNQYINFFNKRVNYKNDLIILI